MKRHAFDPFSLLFGALFVSIGVSFLAGSSIAEAWNSVWPMAAVVVGTTLASWAAVSAFHQRQMVPADIGSADDVEILGAEDVTDHQADPAGDDEAEGEGEPTKPS